MTINVRVAKSLDREVEGRTFSVCINVVQYIFYDVIYR